MKLREWATPLTIGSFTLIAATGILMFFHWDSGFNKTVHEWLGWGLLAAAILHAAANFGAFKRYFKNRTALIVIGVCLLILAASFVSPPGGDRKPPHIAATLAITNAPLSVVAQVANKDIAVVLDQLRRAGIEATAQQSLKQLSGGKRELEMKGLAAIFAQ